MDKACLHCGRVFRQYPPSRAERQKFCSRSCRAKAQPQPAEQLQAIGRGGHSRRPKATRPCAHCGADYRPMSSSSRWCKGCCPHERSVALMQRYGVSWPEWERMLAEQGGMCAICGVRPAVAMDHDHVTNRPRRPLCHRCNGTLAIFEIPGWKERAEAYVQAHR